MLSPQAKRIHLDAYVDAQVKDFNATCKRQQNGSPAFSTHRILVVEDNAICQKIILATLKQSHYCPDLATSGEEALAKYKKGYDAVVLDLGLPGISGIEVCQQIRHNFRDKKTPLIAYSASLHADLYRICSAAGFDAILEKPAKNGELETVIKKLLAW
jgi:CheY-like chemotaxis protein